MRDCIDAEEGRDQAVDIGLDFNLNMVRINIPNVVKTFRSLHTRKASGPDGCPP